MLGLMEIPSLCCIFVHYLESSYTSTMIKVSETAKSKVLQLMQEDGFDPANDYVRVGVKSGGCSFDVKDGACDCAVAEYRADRGTGVYSGVAGA